jgi:DNA invertase Pin-like site-specific DNA recombinase
MSELTPAVAYSYIRFSTPEQAKGDSLRRQTETTRRWCEANGASLDTSTTLRDLGKSAFTGKHRENPDTHALACFLKMVKDGRVPRGSFLVIENLDRLTREKIRVAVRLCLDLIDDGVRIVQLDPLMVFDDESVDRDPTAIIVMVVTLMRGHGESQRKSELVGAAWANKKRLAREKGKVLTLRLPAWVELREGELSLIPDRAAVVRRIFRLAAAGYGLSSVVRRLTADGVPPFGGPGGRWTRSYVGKVLRDRRALGEMQPRRRGGMPDGPPVAGYFPAAVTADEYDAARAGMAQRRRRPGRVGKRVANLFSGMLDDAHGGGSYRVTTRCRGGWRGQVLVSGAAAERLAPACSFPYPAFEQALLSQLAEVSPAEILGRQGAPDDVMVLSGQLARVEASIGLLVAEMDEHGESPTLFRRLRDKEAEQRRLTEALADARQRAAHPLSESWGECQSLAAALDGAPDPLDARLRLRGALRRVVERVYLLIVSRGRDRLAAVQVYFAGGGRHRDYLIWHRPTTANGSARKEGRWWVRSFADAGLPALDLRRRDHARELEADLRAALEAGE